MPSPLFAFFETVADELLPPDSKVITREDMQGDDEAVVVFDDLKEEMGVATSAEAVEIAMAQLATHFALRGSVVPFSYDAATARFTVVDPDYLAFIKAMKNIRSLGTHSRDFECGVATQLGRRATGRIHRVGHPRDTKRTKALFNEHLKTLGFDRSVLLGKDKDGGFDILWMLPLGAVPHQPIVSVQCKNGEFKMKEAHASVGAGLQSFSQHGGLQPSVHVPCVLFNDYIYREMFNVKQLTFVPLGLTDLAALNPAAVAVDLI